MEKEGDDRWWDGWMASLTQWTWVWVNSGSWWRTGRPGVLKSIGSQRVRHDWATKLNWTEPINVSLTEFFAVRHQVPELRFLAIQGTLKSLLRHSAFFIVQLSHPYMTTGKTMALTRWTFASKVMSLLFNMLSRLIIAFLPRSKHHLISWLQWSAVILQHTKNKVCHCFYSFPIYLPWSDVTRCYDLSFMNVEF